MSASVDDIGRYLAARTGSALVDARVGGLAAHEVLDGAVVLVDTSARAIDQEPELRRWLAAANARARHVLIVGSAQDTPRELEAAVHRCTGIDPDHTFSGIAGCVGGDAGPALVMAGIEVHRPPNRAARAVAAVIHVHNDVDVLPEVLAHLDRQGVAAHVFDNWSDDGTWELAQRLASEGQLTHLERFPFGGPPERQRWAEQLELTARYATAVDADWIIHHDADEIRQSPWPDVRLVDAFSRVDELGYNAIDFTVADFRFVTTAGAGPPYERSMRHFEFGTRPGHFLQVKAWRNDTRVDLASSGGHEAAFAGQRVFPLKFLLKHYPLRTPEQARRKVFVDRPQRVSDEERAAGWHVQYDRFTDGSAELLWDPDALIEWDDEFHHRYLVERLTGVGLADRASAAPLVGSVEGDR